MECPYCGSPDLKVLDSRPSAGVIRRRRECNACDRRFTTYEQIASPEIKVTKRGARASEDFDRRKLLRAVERVTRGRPYPERAREALVRGLEAELLDAGITQVASWQLAEKLHLRLVELDPVAAGRFASNYIGDDGALRITPVEERPQLALPFSPAAAPVAPKNTASPPPEPARPPRKGKPRSRRPEAPSGPRRR